MFQWIVNALWNVINAVLDYAKNSLPLVMDFVLELMPAGGALSLAPYVNIIKAANEWIPISECFVTFELWVAFRISWAGVKILLRVFSFGFAGRD